MQNMNAIEKRQKTRREKIIDNYHTRIERKQKNEKMHRNGCLVIDVASYRPISPS
jgi:hypothetical protein